MAWRVASAISCCALDQLSPKSGFFGTVGTESSATVLLNAVEESVLLRGSTSPSLATALPDGRAHSVEVRDPSVASLPRESIMSLSNAEAESHRHGQPPAADLSVSTLESSTAELLAAHERMPVDLRMYALGLAA